MVRDVFKTAEHGKEVLSSRRQMSIDEAKQLLNIFESANDKRSGLWDLLVTTYHFGVSLGYRQAQADLKRR